MFLKMAIAVMQNGKKVTRMDDLISRADAIDMAYGCEDEFGKDVVFRFADYIRQLPSVQPKILACGSGGQRMIKKPVYFAIGIFCGMCFIINIVNGRDAFTLLINAFSTAVNITYGMYKSEDKG